MHEQQYTIRFNFTNKAFADTNFIGTKADIDQLLETLAKTMQKELGTFTLVNKDGTAQIFNLRFVTTVAFWIKEIE